jgi:hypothetical protein
MAGQATVVVNRFNDRAARQHLETPVVARGGSIRSVTLTIPLLEPDDRQRRGRYLVVEMPRETVQELTRRALELPEDRRAGFLKTWIMRNQQAVLDQYLRIRDERGAEQIRRFRYDVVPVPTAAAARAAVPRRAAERRTAPRTGPAPQPQPIGGLVIRRRAPPPAEREDVPERPILPQFRPRQTEGTGTRESPLVIQVPVPVSDSDQIGEQLHEGVAPLLYQPASGSAVSMQVRVRFVGARPAAEGQQTTRRELHRQVEGLLVSSFRRYLREERRFTRRQIRDAEGAIRTTLSRAARSIVTAAARNDAVRAYAPE